MESIHVNAWDIFVSNVYLVKSKAIACAGTTHLVSKDST